MRIAKSAIPDNIQVTKEAKQAFAKAAGIFIVYLTTCAERHLQGQEEADGHGARYFGGVRRARVGRCQAPARGVPGRVTGARERQAQGGFCSGRGARGAAAGRRGGTCSSRDYDSDDAPSLARDRDGGASVKRRPRVYDCILYGAVTRAPRRPAAPLAASCITPRRRLGWPSSTRTRLHLDLLPLAFGGHFTSSPVWQEQRSGDLCRSGRRGRRAAGRRTRDADAEQRH